MKAIGVTHTQDVTNASAGSLQANYLRISLLPEFIGPILSGLACDDVFLGRIFAEIRTNNVLPQARPDRTVQSQSIMYKILNFDRNSNFRQIVWDLQHGVGVTFRACCGGSGGCFMVSELKSTIFYKNTPP